MCRWASSGESWRSRCPLVERGVSAITAPLLLRVEPGEIVEIELEGLGQAGDWLLGRKAASRVGVAHLGKPFQCARRLAKRRWWDTIIFDDISK